MSLQAFLAEIIVFVNMTLIPLILGLALVFFLFNLARYFFWFRDAEANREKARRNALWGILGFVVIVSIWGIVNLLVSGLGFDRQNAPCPDYNPNCRNTGFDNGFERNDNAWNPDQEHSLNGACIFGMSCQMVEGVRVCEYCFLSEY